MARDDGSPATQDLVEVLTQAYQRWNAGQADHAERLCRGVLAEWPGQPDALHLLGLIAHAYGSHDLALDYVREACRSPRAPGMFFRNLAEMCRLRGLLDEGEQAGRRAVALEPGHVDGWNNLGVVLQENGRIDEGLACLRRALGLQPGDPKILNNLGNTCRLAGRLDDAGRYYLEALALDPESAQTNSNLSALAAARGDLDAGAGYAQAALACEPHFVEAYLNLAEIANLRGDRKDALRWIDSVLRFAPNEVRALNLKTRILLQGGRVEDAFECIQHACVLAPGNGEAQNRLGDVLLALDRPEDALLAFQRAADAPGRSVEDALINRALALQACGRIDEAGVAFDQVLERFPHSSRARVARTDSRTVRPGDPDVAALDLLAATPDRLDAQQQVAVRFALAKACFDLGEGARAFEHLEVGNRLKRGTFTYDPAQTTDWLQRIADAFPAALAPPPGAPASGRPVFIVGMPRSGSTLLEQILASHPQIGAAGELPALQLEIERAGGAFPDNVARWTDDVWAEIGRRYIEATASIAPARPHLIDKMPSNFLYAGVIARALPGARIIHCRRDPVDTALSCYARNFAGEQPFCYDQRELGLFYRDYHRLMAHWRRVLPAGCMIEVDYEDVVADLAGQSRRVLDFLGLPWSDACLDFHLTRRAVRTASAPQVRQKLYVSAVGRWRAHRVHLGPLLQALGDLVP